MNVSHDITGALRAQIGSSHTPLVLVFDARGNGGGKICPTITGDHQDRITDYTAIVVETDERTVSASLWNRCERERRSVDDS